jgi:phosphatidylglycerophosphate synthase
MQKSKYDMNILEQKRIKDDDDFFTLKCTRKISKYFTQMLLFTSISANQATIIDICLGIISAILFSFGNYSYSIIAAFILQLWYVFDCVDGEIARARSQCSSEGLYLDYVGHDIVQPCVYIGIGFGLINSTDQFMNISLLGNYWMLLLSFLCCHFSMLRDNMMSI